ncbi:MAG: hypothetical protein V4615_06640, partial [Bacteroidota bacterium]
KKFGQAEETSGTSASGQYEGQQAETGAEPWKQQLQNINLEGDEQSETGSTSSYGSSQKESESTREEESYSSGAGKEKSEDSYQTGKRDKKDRKSGRKEEGAEEQELEEGEYEEEESGEERTDSFAELGKKTMNGLSS